MPASFCTLTLSKHLLPEERSYSLSALCGTIGYDFDAHNALADAEACAELLLYLADLAKVEDVNDFESILRRPMPVRTVKMFDANYPTYLEDNALLGHCFVFTGDLEAFSRENATAIASRLGAHVVSMPSKYTTVVVVGKYAPGVLRTELSAKHQKALDLIDGGQTIEMLDEEAFLQLLDGERILSVSPSMPPELMEFYRAMLDGIPEVKESFPEMRPISKGMSVYFYRQKAVSFTSTKSKGCTMEIDAWYIDDPDQLELPYTEIKTKVKTENEADPVTWQVIGYRYAVDVERDQRKLIRLLGDICADKFYSANVERFACCNSFELCSDEKVCLHREDWDYVGCEYRRNLKAGRIFFGKNKNC